MSNIQDNTMNLCEESQTPNFTPNQDEVVKSTIKLSTEIKDRLNEIYKLFEEGKQIDSELENKIDSNLDDKLNSILKSLIGKINPNKNTTESMNESTQMEILNELLETLPQTINTNDMNFLKKSDNTDNSLVADFI
jgi:hypothetical protein